MLLSELLVIRLLLLLLSFSNLKFVILFLLLLSNLKFVVLLFWNLKFVVARLVYWLTSCLWVPIGASISDIFANPVVQ